MHWREVAMEPKDESIKNRLLAQHVPEPAMLTAYRKEMEAMLEQNEIRLRRDKWYSGALWIFVVLMGTTFLVLGGRQVSKPIATFLAVSACFFLISAAVKLIEYFINRSRV